MNQRKAAAITWFVIAAYALYRAVKCVVAFQPGFTFGEPFSPFLVRWGDAVAGLPAAAAMIGVGLYTLRARDPAEHTKELHFVYEPVIPLGPVMAGFLLWLATASFTAIPSYTGERGLVWGQLAAVGFLVPGFLFGAWVLLHYRRLALIDPGSKTVEVSYGKPWAALRRRFPFSDHEVVNIDAVPRARGGMVYRVMAVGARGRRLITFTFNEESANRIADELRRATGWK